MIIVFTHVVSTYVRNVRAFQNLAIENNVRYWCDCGSGPRGSVMTPILLIHEAAHSQAVGITIFARVVCPSVNLNKTTLR